MSNQNVSETFQAFLASFIFFYVPLENNYFTIVLPVLGNQVSSFSILFWPGCYDNCCGVYPGNLSLPDEIWTRTSYRRRRWRASDITVIETVLDHSAVNNNIEMMKTFSVVSFVNEFRISKITYLRSLVASQTLYSKINLSRVCYLSTYHKKRKRFAKRTHYTKWR